MVLLSNFAIVYSINNNQRTLPLYSKKAEMKNYSVTFLTFFQKSTFFEYLVPYITSMMTTEGFNYIIIQIHYFVLTFALRRFNDLLKSCAEKIISEFFR